MLSLREISLYQFKNYQQTSFRFEERIIGICGRNGVGKTNLLDAIYYLCFTKSYFSRADQQNVRKGLSGFRIEGQFDKQDQPLKVVCILRENGKKEVQAGDEVYAKFSEHIGRVPCVIIAPDDIQIITGGSEERRRMLDALLSQLDQSYLQQLIEYNKVLTQRNSYLKSLADQRSQDKSLLEVYDSQLVRPGNYIFEKRRVFLAEWLPLVQDFYVRIAGTEEPLSFTYESQLLQTTLADLLARNREKDLYLQRTNGGIHKDDIEIGFSGQPFKSYASQGQRKSLLFALKLAEFETLKTHMGFPPLLLLDDVFEKLDEHRMRNLLEKVCLTDAGQVFITDPHAVRIRQEMDKLGIGFQIIELQP